MFRSLFKLAIIVIAAILVYNFFFGTSDEKENSRKVFRQMQGVVVSMADLVKSERAKFDEGKYDAALQKLGGAYRAIRDQAKNVDEKVLKRLDKLEERKSELEKELASLQQTDDPPPVSGKKSLKADPKSEQAKAVKAADRERRKEMLQKELEALLNDSDKLLQDAQQ